MQKSTKQLIAEAAELLQGNPSFSQLALAVELLSAAFRIESRIKQISDNELWQKTKAQHNG